MGQTAQVSWELTSPVLGAVLHKHLPRDTYTVYKRGCRLRVDGHMKGMHEDGNTLLPCWKYGHFSILVDTDPQSAVQPLYVSHDKQQYTVVDVRPESLVRTACRRLMRSDVCESGRLHPSILVLLRTLRSVGGSPADRVAISAETCLLQDLDEADDGANAGADSNAHLNRSQEVKRSRVKFSKFQLAPVRGWVSGDLHEKVNGFPCTVRVSRGTCPVQRSGERAAHAVAAALLGVARPTESQTATTRGRVATGTPTAVVVAGVRGARRAHGGDDDQGGAAVADGRNLRGVPRAAARAGRSGGRAAQL